METLIHILESVSDWLWDLLRRRPAVWIPIVWAIVRSFGTTVQTGSTGVLFVWGRARRTLDPGFHWLVPFVQHARSTPTRSITLDLPRQRVTTAEGLVYNVDATLVYRVDDPIRCLTEIDDAKQGCNTALPLAIQELMRQQTKATLVDRRALDDSLAERVQARLATWGLIVEQAGLTSIAPTRASLKLSQLGLRIKERRQAFQISLAAGMSVRGALALLGTPRPPLGKSAARYRQRRGRTRNHPVALAKPIPASPPANVQI